MKPEHHGQKAGFVEHFKQYIETTFREPFDNLDDIRRSKLMARFFAEIILGPRNPALLPSVEEDIAACMVDGKDDVGVDFISREEGVVLIIQAKYSGRKKQKKRPVESASDFESFRSVLERLRNFRNLAINEPLREIAAEIDWETDRFQLFYITLRQLTTNQAGSSVITVTPITDLPGSTR